MCYCRKGVKERTCQQRKRFVDNTCTDRATHAWWVLAVGRWVQRSEGGMQGGSSLVMLGLRCNCSHTRGYLLKFTFHHAGKEAKGSSLGAKVAKGRGSSKGKGL